jgi:hypothetical protein
MSSLNLSHLVNWTALREQCSGNRCHVRNLSHSLLGRKNGVRIGESWYCSPECFRDGVENRLWELRHAEEHRSVAHRLRLPLGLLLVSRGCITNQQLRIAVERQRDRKGSLGEILCDLQYATERQVTEARATQWGCPVYSAKIKLTEIQARIPTALLRLAAMAPVYHATAANRLLIGFVDGIDHHALHTVEEMTGCLTEPCFITSSECRDSIHNLSGRNIEVSFDRVSSVAETANIVQSYAFQIAANEARFAICHGLLWVRLNRETQPTDLMFSVSHDKLTKTEFADDFLGS